MFDSADCMARAAAIRHAPRALEATCIRGHVFCSFLTLLLRKELDDRLRNTLTPATDSEGVRKAAEEFAGLRAAR